MSHKAAWLRVSGNGKPYRLHLIAFRHSFKDPKTPRQLSVLSTTNIRILSINGIATITLFVVVFVFLRAWGSYQGFTVRFCCWFCAFGPGFVAFSAREFL